MANAVGDITDPLGTLRPDEPTAEAATHKFRPIRVEERLQKMYLSRHIKPNDACSIFSLFFDDDILTTIAQNTNLYAPIQKARLQAKKPDPKHARTPWKDVLVTELRAYLGIFIYRSIHEESDRSDYWTVNPKMASHQIITEAISRNRFDQLEQIIHVAKPENASENPKKKKKAFCFHKLEPLNTHLLSIAKKLWKPSSELAVDEFMVRFTGRAKEIVTIPAKPIPTGIKGWGIADKGYFLHWYWHAKGKGPQGVPKKPAELNPTAAVVPALLDTLPKPSQPQNTNAPYAVTLDNLFSSTKLMNYLWEHDYGARGTANIKGGIHADLVSKKRKDDATDCIPWGMTEQKFVADGKVCQLMWKDNSLCLFLSNMEDGTETIMTKRHQPNTSMKHSKSARKPFGDQAEKELPRPVLTFKYNHLMNQVDRGDQRMAAYPIQQRQMKAWKTLFYELVNIVVLNAYLISLYSTVPKKEKFTNHKAFRVALYTGLFKHATPGSSRTTRTQEVNHCSIPIKRSACVVCKASAGRERRKGIRLKAQALQEISPNKTAKLKDKHVYRSCVGCDVCDVNLCSSSRSKRCCWETYHRDQKIEAE